MKYKPGDKIKIEARISEEARYGDGHSIYTVEVPSKDDETEIEFELTDEELKDAELIDRPVTFSKEQVEAMKKFMFSKRCKSSDEEQTNDSTAHWLDEHVED